MSRSISATPIAPRSVRERSIAAVELGGHGTVVQQPGQRVAASGLEELDRLACDPHLRAAKDEIQEQPGDRSGDERHGQHLLLHVAERADDRCRIRQTAAIASVDPLASIRGRYACRTG